MAKATKATPMAAFTATINREMMNAAVRLNGGYSASYFPVKPTAGSKNFTVMGDHSRFVEYDAMGNARYDVTDQKHLIEAALKRMGARFTYVQSKVVGRRGFFLVERASIS